MQEVHTHCQHIPFWQEGHGIIIKESFYSFCNIEERFDVDPDSW